MRIPAVKFIETFSSFVSNASALLRCIFYSCIDFFSKCLCKKKPSGLPEIDSREVRFKKKLAVWRAKGKAALAKFKRNSI